MVNRAEADRRSPASIERCIFAHEAVDDEPTPAVFRVVELEAGRERVDEGKTD
jgi:hypothetical protein